MNCNCEKSKNNSEYIKRIIGMIGAVILGSKPSEIINIPGSKCEKQSKLNQIQLFFNDCSKITYRMITTIDGGKRVLFINETIMEKVLDNKRCINFLKFIGYPHTYNQKDYINQLVSKLESDNFPHEIGIFLGYPLKDVLGFMGYGKKDLVEIRNWNIYGDKEISYQIYNTYTRDKKIMKEMVQKASIKELKEVI